MYISSGIQTHDLGVWESEDSLCYKRAATVIGSESSYWIIIQNQNIVSLNIRAKQREILEYFVRTVFSEEQLWCEMEGSLEAKISLLFDPLMFS
jgi:hypothetical protein